MLLSQADSQAEALEPHEATLDTEAEGPSSSGRSHAPPGPVAFLSLETPVTVLRGSCLAAGVPFSISDSKLALIEKLNPQNRVAETAAAQLIDDPGGEPWENYEMAARPEAAAEAAAEAGDESQGAAWMRHSVDEKRIWTELHLQRAMRT